MCVDEKRFEEAKKKILNTARLRQSIGTLSEKTIHAVVKNFYEPEETRQEVPVGGLVADIFTGTEIIEIQTRSFDKVRKKLDYFLPLYPVTIVYPLPRQKWITWIDEETGEVTSRRKSPKRGNPYEAFKEFYKIKSYLQEPGLTLKILLMDMEEYRLLNGWSQDRKKGSTRYDRIPVGLPEEITLERVEDYLQFLPYDLSEHFTAKELGKRVSISKELAGQVLHILHYLGLVERVGKEGRSYLYKVNTLC